MADKVKLAFIGAGGVVHLSSRGVLVVLATFVLAHLARNPILGSQSRRAYAVRFVGAVLMVKAP